jgi:hypothetical protein
MIESPTAPLPDVSSPETARAGLNAFFRLAEQWKLTRSDQKTLLGLRSDSTLDNWRKKAPATLSPDTLERLSYLLHIYRSLRQLFPEDRVREWPRRTNDASPFLGRTALAFMLEGRIQNLLDVHRYLKRYASGAF